MQWIAWCPCWPTGEGPAGVADDGEPPSPAVAGLAGRRPAPLACRCRIAGGSGGRRAQEGAEFLGKIGRRYRVVFDDLAVGEAVESQTTEGNRLPAPTAHLGGVPGYDGVSLRNQVLDVEPAIGQRSRQAGEHPLERLQADAERSVRIARRNQFVDL